MLVCIFVTMLSIPFGIRVETQRAVSRLRPRSISPRYESSRQREPFDPDPISDLARLKPGYVVIGDSMAGTN